jgi:glycerol uptake facilitator protein
VSTSGGGRSSHREAGATTGSDPVRPGRTFVAEFVDTFILVFTVFGVIHRRGGASVGAAPVPVGPHRGPARHPVEASRSTFTPAATVPAAKEPRSHR